MFDFIMKGGLLMYPILCCSVIAVAIILERLYHFYRAGININDFIGELRGPLERGDKKEARAVMESYSVPVARVALLALTDHHDRFAMEEAVSRAGTREIRRLERNLRGLSIIANVAPLLGLLGTVTGMIRTFIKIQELGGKVDVAVLAGGIWEAMITTGAGLAVAIPAMVAYHLFEGKADEIAENMKEAVSEIGMLVGIRKVKSFIDESAVDALREEEGYGL